MLNGGSRRAKDELSMVVRLLLGLCKGLLIGSLVGFGLAQLGFAAPAAWLAYLSAALVGALVGLVAGKPIWAADGRIEAGLKAGFGAVLALGLMALARNFLGFGLPFDLGSLAAANRSLGESAASGTFGGLAITSLAMVAGLLGAFYDADNTPEPKSEGAAAKGGDKARIADKSAALGEDEDLAEEDAPQRKQSKR